MKLLHARTGLTADPATGIVYGKAGKPIGTVSSLGYITISHGTRKDGITSSGAHRIVWEAAMGEVPEGYEVHHHNGVKTDNRLSNLQLVTHSENIAIDYRRNEAVQSLDITPETARQICSTVGVVTSAEWSDDLGVPEEAVLGLRQSHHRLVSNWARQVTASKGQQEQQRKPTPVTGR